MAVRSRMGIASRVGVSFVVTAIGMLFVLMGAVIAHSTVVHLWALVAGLAFFIGVDVVILFRWWSVPVLGILAVVTFALRQDDAQAAALVAWALAGAVAAFLLSRTGKQQSRF
jgi:hypothetical protein